MKSSLRKQVIIVNEDVKEDEAEPNEQKQAEPTVKFYGKETLSAVQDRIWFDMIIYFVCVLSYFFKSFDDHGIGNQKSEQGKAN